jgi:hypothetical protein
VMRARWGALAAAAGVAAAAAATVTLPVDGAAPTAEPGVPALSPVDSAAVDTPAGASPRKFAARAFT